MDQINNLKTIMDTMKMNFIRNMTEEFFQVEGHRAFQDREEESQEAAFQGKEEAFRAVDFLEADQVDQAVSLEEASREAEHRHRRHLNSLRRKHKHPYMPLTRAELEGACIAIRMSGWRMAEASGIFQPLSAGILSLAGDGDVAGVGFISVSI